MRYAHSAHFAHYARYAHSAHSAQSAQSAQSTMGVADMPILPACSAQAPANAAQDDLDIDSASGAIRCRRYRDVYRSVHGALEESLAVFAAPGWAHLTGAERLGPSGAPQVASAPSGQITATHHEVLELGFGLGTNLTLFLAFWAAHLRSSAPTPGYYPPQQSAHTPSYSPHQPSTHQPGFVRPCHPAGQAAGRGYLVFHSVEAHPLDAAALVRAWHQLLRPQGALQRASVPGTFNPLPETLHARISAAGDTGDGTVGDTGDGTVGDIADDTKDGTADGTADDTADNAADGTTNDIGEGFANPIREQFPGLTESERLRNFLQPVLSRHDRSLPAWVEILARDNCFRLPGVHRFELLPGFFLDLHIGEATTVLGRLDRAPQLVLLDGFSPKLNPAMWDAKLLRTLRCLLPPEALLLSYATAPALRADLAQLDFVVSRRPGFLRKRYRLEASFRPRGAALLKAQRHAASHATRQTAPIVGADKLSGRLVPAQRRLLILGAGLAGRTMAQEALHRGWAVTLIDPRPATVVEETALPAYLEHPHLSPDDNPLARLSRAALLHCRRTERGVPLSSGRRQILDAADAARWERLLARLRIRSDLQPDPWQELVSLHRHDLASELRFPRAAAQAFPALDPALQRVALPSGINHDGSAWWVQDAAGMRIASGEVVIIASAPALALCSPPLAQQLIRTPGASLTLDLATLAPTHPLWNLDTIVAGSVQAVRLPSAARGAAGPSARLLIGALYGEECDPAVHRKLLDGLRHTVMLDDDSFAALRLLPFRILRGERWSVSDHLPLIGRMPDLAGISARYDSLRKDARRQWPGCANAYLLCALGSRGILWARFGAELILNHLEGLPSVLEEDLRAAIDPARFMIRNARRGLGHNLERHAQQVSQVNSQASG